MSRNIEKYYARVKSGNEKQCRTYGLRYYKHKASKRPDISSASGNMISQSASKVNTPSADTPL